MDVLLKNIVIETLCVDPEWVTEEAVLIDAPNADSLDIVELQMACEESYGVLLPDLEMSEVNTVGDLQRLIEGKPRVKRRR